MPPTRARDKNVVVRAIVGSFPSGSLFPARRERISFASTPLGELSIPRWWRNAPEERKRSSGETAARRVPQLKQSLKSRLRADKRVHSGEFAGASRERIHEGTSGFRAARIESVTRSWNYFRSGDGSLPEPYKLALTGVGTSPRRRGGSISEGLYTCRAKLNIEYRGPLPHDAVSYLCIYYRAA